MTSETPISPDAGEVRPSRRGARSGGTRMDSSGDSARMRIMIASGHPYLPELLGGAQSCTHELALSLRARGHEVTVMAGLVGRGRFGLGRRAALKLGRRGWVRDEAPGYPVLRTWFPWTVVTEAARSVAADVILFQSGFPVRMAAAMEDERIGKVIYLHNVEREDLGGEPAHLDDVLYIANSRFTANRFASADGIESEVVLPMVAAERYPSTSARRNVTFINPHPHKGVHLALDVAARCPEIPFVFVRAWSLCEDDARFLNDAVARLDNITLRGPTQNMADVYGEARIVLAPSRWEEAFGRVAAEAHLAGVPVVGSDRGGLPEAIGPGGLVLPADAPAETWAAAIRNLWSDKGMYGRMSAAARDHAGRAGMNADMQVDRILDVLSRARARAMEVPCGY